MNQSEIKTIVQNLREILGEDTWFKILSSEITKAYSPFISNRIQDYVERTTYLRGERNRLREDFVMDDYDTSDDRDDITLARLLLKAYKSPDEVGKKRYIFQRRFSPQRYLSIIHEVRALDFANKRKQAKKKKSWEMTTYEPEYDAFDHSYLYKKGNVYVKSSAVYSRDGRVIDYGKVVSSPLLRTIEGKTIRQGGKSPCSICGRSDGVEEYYHVVGTNISICQHCKDIAVSQREGKSLPHLIYTPMGGKTK